MSIKFFSKQQKTTEAVKEILFNLVKLTEEHCNELTNLKEYYRRRRRRLIALLSFAYE